MSGFAPAQFFADRSSRSETTRVGEGQGRRSGERSRKGRLFENSTAKCLSEGRFY